MRDVLGEGAFGCVLKPSLKCKDTHGIPYDHYISKLMKSKSAKKELSEFLIISQLDKTNSYHLGTPTICVPDIKEADVIKDIKKCQSFQAEDIMLHPKDYRILILEDGGYDLSIFCRIHLESFVKNPDNCKIFWRNAHHLFKGLVFFKKNDIIHYDLKPQNIVFDPTTMKFKFIDFGLMKRASSVLETSKKSENKASTFHWSYPIDNGFLNKSYFSSYKKLSKEQKNDFKTLFSKEILTRKDTENGTNGIIKNPGSFNLLFYYIYLDPHVHCVENDLSLFFDTYNTYLSKHTYKSISQKTVDSIDIYGLGFTLKYVLNQFYKQKGVPEEFYKKASVLFESMYSFDYKTRCVSAEQALKQYEDILLRNEKSSTSISKSKSSSLNKSSSKSASSSINKSSKSSASSSINKSMDKSKSIHITPKLEETAYNDPVQIISNHVPMASLQEIVVNCKEKELNPITKRCVKKCKTGKIRNEYFRCTDKTKTQKNRKMCSEDKELNPLTNRCVKKCKTGKVRNSNFNCVSQKNKKSSPMLNIYS